MLICLFQYKGLALYAMIFIFLYCILLVLNINICNEYKYIYIRYNKFTHEKIIIIKNLLHKMECGEPESYIIYYIDITRNLIHVICYYC